MKWLALSVTLAACARQDFPTNQPDLAIPLEDLGGADLRGADLRAVDLGGNAVDLAAACMCEPGQRCISGACQYVDQMQVRLGQLANQIIDGGYTTATFVYQNMACFYHPLTDLTNQTVVATDGPCTVYQATFVQDAGASNPLFLASAGTVTVSGGTQGSYTLAPAGPGSGCYYASLVDPPHIFSEGQQITVATTGGSDFPAFTKTVTAPAPITITTGSIQRGQPLTVSWTGSAPGEKVSLWSSVQTNTEAITTFCSVDDTGSYTIPASLTAHYPNQAVSYAGINAERQRVAREDPASPLVTMTVFLWSTATRPVSYQP